MKRPNHHSPFDYPADTTLKFHRETLDRLAKFGEFGDTWETIIIKLMRKS